MHVRKPALEPPGQGLVCHGGSDNRLDDFMEVGDALDRIGEGLLLDLGVLRPDTVADGAIGSCSEAKNTYATFEDRTVCQQ